MTDARQDKPPEPQGKVRHVAYCHACDSTIQSDGSCSDGCDYGDARKRILVLRTEAEAASRE